MGALVGLDRVRIIGEELVDFIYTIGRPWINSRYTVGRVKDIEVDHSHVGKVGMDWELLSGHQCDKSSDVRVASCSWSYSSQLHGSSFCRRLRGIRGTRYGL